MSVVLVATVHPKPEHRDEVIAVFETVIAKVHADEPGCELYALHEGEDSLVMIEKYTDQEAVDAHRRGAGLKELVAGLDGKLSAPLDVRVLRPHPAGSADKGAL
ncbi:MAG TPA: putative quinol monooxygenase [Pseudonocardiaceae bacterium]|jgi:quinol monooxygenase YgiN|nr:putative quinol monooxygenase [Pseudonocardiaceae bacterium]